MAEVNALVVDDEEVVLESCRRALSSQGYCVAAAQTVDQALEKLAEQGFDVVIADLVMHKKGGMDLLKIVKQEYPHTQVIMITGYSSINTAVESIKLGAFDYLAKPFSPSELLLTVKKALEEKGRLLERFVSDQELPSQMIFENIIGNSPRMIDVFKIISKVAATDTTVLIIGESGTGKELVARAIHNNSHRRDSHFVVVDCLTLTHSLLESELFGHVKGSFTGAVSAKAGFFEIANGGTLFLDEIGDLSFELQGKLLRVIQERKYIPVGGTEQRETDIRLIAATNKNLKKMVETGTFREDLFYRLYVVPIFLPPLRDRKEDIPVLIDHFLKRIAEKNRRPVPRVPEKTLKCLLAYDWQGNIRELENTMERASIHFEGDQILPHDLPEHVQLAATQKGCQVPETIRELKEVKKQLRERATEDIEKEFVLSALAGNGWSVSQSAKSVGMQRTNFYRLIRKHNIALPHGAKDTEDPP
ncbi:MAG: sigma-54 dependent transcriptional regulator [bacterium]